MAFRILGIGTAVPEHAVTQEDAAQHAVHWCCETADDQRRLELLYRQSGVRTRRSVHLQSPTNSHSARQDFFADRQETPFGPSTAQRMQRYAADGLPLAVEAARAALAAADVLPSQISQLVTVSCTGFVAPGIDIGLIETLGLPRDCGRTHIGFMGCHGALNGLRVADALAANDPGARVLMCAVELCTLHQQYGWRTDQILANALFADGAAAVVGDGRDELDDGWALRASTSCVVPRSLELMSWRVRDHGFEMTLSPEVPAVIRESLGPWLQEWLGKQGFSVNEIQSWAIHPGGPKILQAVAEAAPFDPQRLEASTSVLAEFGNMSSPTILFILDRLRQRAEQPPCVALAFGPGLTIEAALLV